MNEQTLNPAIANPSEQNASKPLDAPKEVMSSTPDATQTKRNNPRPRITGRSQHDRQTPHLRSTPGRQPRQCAKIDRSPHPRR